MTLIGVTDADLAKTQEYRFDRGLAFPILADAASTREAWGVEMIWGNVVRLVDPQGQVVAESLGDARRVLAKR